MAAPPVFGPYLLKMSGGVFFVWRCLISEKISLSLSLAGSPLTELSRDERDDVVVEDALVGVTDDLLRGQWAVRVERGQRDVLLDDVREARVPEAADEICPRHVVRLACRQRPRLCHVVQQGPGADDPAVDVRVRPQRCHQHHGDHTHLERVFSDVRPAPVLREDAEALIDRWDPEIDGTARVPDSFSE